MGYVIKGAKNVEEFKRELLQNKYGFFTFSPWNILVSEEREVGLAIEENNCLGVLPFFEEADGPLQNLCGKYCATDKENAKKSP